MTNKRTMNQIIEVLNKCDVAYFEGMSLAWFFDEEENTIAFYDSFDDHLFTVFNEIQFTFNNSVLCFTLENGMSMQLDLYKLQCIN